VAVVLLIAAPLQGCISDMIQASQASQDHQNYSNYLLATEKLNTDRQEHGLQPEPVMTYDQWKDAGTP
jgi:hypothetical protein